MAEYKIGVNHSDLDWMKSQFPKDKLNDMTDPRGDPMEYAETISLADGTNRGVGWLQQVWHWDIISEDQCATLRGFIGNVNILTRNNSGTFSEYTGVLKWPESEPEHFDNHVLDVNIKIIKMVAFP